MGLRKKVDVDIDRHAIPFLKKLLDLHALLPTQDGMIG
jgi:hypothetical protein